MGTIIPQSSSLDSQPGMCRLERVGLQLYTVRNLMAASVAGTLEQVAKIGYKEVEFAGYFDTPPGRLRRWLDELGLSAPAAHVSLLDGELSQLLDDAAELGHRYLVQASLPLWQRRSVDGFRRAAASLNRAGRRHRAGTWQWRITTMISSFARTAESCPTMCSSPKPIPRWCVWKSTCTGWPRRSETPSGTLRHTLSGSACAISRTWMGGGA